MLNILRFQKKKRYKKTILLQKKSIITKNLKKQSKKKCIFEKKCQKGRLEFYSIL